MDDLIQEAIEFLREHLQYKKEVFVAFSGGKDSIVTTELVKLSGIHHQLYYYTSAIEPPEMLKFVRQHYPQTIILRPATSYWSMILTKNPPLPRVRWCCDHLRERPSSKIKIPHRVLGIRKEESVNRSKYPRVDRPKHSYRWQRLYYPILDWNDADVWEFIESRELHYPSLYDTEVDRIGCVICPFMNSTKHQWARQRYPGIYRAFENTIRKWYATRKAQGKPMQHNSPEEFLHDWYNKKARWFKKEVSND